MDVKLLSISLNRLAFRSMEIRVFSRVILKILNRCIVSHCLKCACGCVTSEKYIYVKNAWILDCFRYHVVFLHCIVSR